MRTTDQFTTVSEVLTGIREQFGDKAVLNGDRCVAYFSDMAPKLKRERHLLQLFFNCGGADLGMQKNSVDRTKTEEEESRANFSAAKDAYDTFYSRYSEIEKQKEEIERKIEQISQAVNSALSDQHSPQDTSVFCSAVHSCEGTTAVNSERFDYTKSEI